MGLIPGFPASFTSIISSRYTPSSCNSCFPLFHIRFSPLPPPPPPPPPHPPPPTPRSAVRPLGSSSPSASIHPSSPCKFICRTHHLDPGVCKRPEVCPGSPSMV